MSLKYFELSDFDCPCCGKNEMDEEFLLDLDAARGLAHYPFIIDSGFRCPKHNSDLKGSSPTSSHLIGLASDIFTPNSEARYKVLNGLILVGFKRIGIGRNFIHADRDKDKPQRVSWLY